MLTLTPYWNEIVTADADFIATDSWHLLFCV